MCRRCRPLLVYQVTNQLHGSLLIECLLSSILEQVGVPPGVSASSCLPVLADAPLSSIWLSFTWYSMSFPSLLLKRCIMSFPLCLPLPFRSSQTLCSMIFLPSAISPDISHHGFP